MRSRDTYAGWKRDGDKRIAELEAENASLKADLQRERGVLTDEERQAFLDKICSTGLD